MEKLINNKRTEQVYDDILHEVRKLVEMMHEGNDNSEILIAQRKASEILVGVEKDIREEYDSLKKNVEWDRFTIAFYGETNAGKSTIIETLRILLREKTKLETERKFQEIQTLENISQENFDYIQEEIMKALKGRKEKENELAQYDRDYKDKLKKEELLLNRLRDELEEEVENRDFIERLLYFFLKSPLMKKVDNQQNVYDNLIQEYSCGHDLIMDGISAFQEMEKESRDKLKRLEEKSNLLLPYADGSIIGSGKSDFTQKNTTYRFNYNGQEFDLIDVPGIEGKESTIIESVMEAVQKAHVVFFVTRKPTPPQVGDNKEGTLNKIKKHLGAQTEVWTIFNQSITNPMQLSRPIIKEDEEKSLQELHKTIAEKLGNEHYRGEIVLSAYPSFLSVAKSLIPGRLDYKSREKFLKKYSTLEIIQATKFNHFIDLLHNDITNDAQNKIIYSNYNKAMDVLRRANYQIETIRRETFSPLERAFKQNYEDSHEKIANRKESFVSKVGIRSEDLIDTLKSNVRDKMYAHIEDDISNDEFKELLEIVMDEEKDKLNDSFIKIVREEVDDFQNDVTEIVRRTVKNFAEQLNIKNDAKTEFDINLDFNFDSGIQWKKLMASLTGGVIAVITTGGWVLVAGIITAFIGVIDSVWSFFSSSHKRKQQKKNVEKSINNIAGSINSSIQDALGKIREKTDESIGGVYKSIYVPYKAITEINLKLKDASKVLKAMQE